MSRLNRVNRSATAPLVPLPNDLLLSPHRERQLNGPHESFPETVNIVQRVGFKLAMVYLFAVASLMSETSIHAFGFKPYVTMVFGPLAVACGLISGGVRRAFSASPGFWLIGFALWLAFVAPFSVWRTGSLDLLGVFYLKSLPTYFMVAAFVVSRRNFRRFVYVLAASVVAILFVALAYGHDTGGRFAISFGSFENPNDFSMHLVVLLPFLLFVHLNSRSLSPVRGLMATAIAASIFTIIQTGSRSGAIGLAAVTCMIVAKASPVQRVVLGFLFALSAVCALVLLPSTLMQRFETIFSPMSTRQELGPVRSDGTIGSNIGRFYLLRRSIRLTAENPLVGVGPGQFEVAESSIAEKEGGRGIGRGTHNSYTEVSSETGLIGLFLFVGTLFGCIRATNRVYKQARARRECAQLSTLAFCLLASLTGFAVNIIFCHVAYTYYLPMFTGMTVSLVRLAHWEIRKCEIPSLP